MSEASRPTSPSDGSGQRKGRGLMPPEIVDFLLPPLQFGGYCGENFITPISGKRSENPLLTIWIYLGGAGAFTGVGAGILSDASPLVSGIMTGTQWAVLGTTYWCKSVPASASNAQSC